MADMKPQVLSLPERKLKTPTTASNFTCMRMYSQELERSKCIRFGVGQRREERARRRHLVAIGHFHICWVELGGEGCWCIRKEKGIRTKGRVAEEREGTRRGNVVPVT
jgi:hypothetical protein